jgi:hypothetical protein
MRKCKGVIKYFNWDFGYLYLILSHLNMSAQLHFHQKKKKKIITLFFKIFLI